MNLQLFIYKQLAIQFYYSPLSIANEKVVVDRIFLVFPGLPQYINKDFFESRVDGKTAFMSVHYLGSWLSGGEFNYKNCLKSVDIALEFVKNKQGVKTFDNKIIEWQYSSLCAVGYSFSGNVLLASMEKLHNLDQVILCAPVICIHKDDYKNYTENKRPDKSFYEYNAKYLGFLRRGYKFLLRGIVSPTWAMYFGGKDALSKVDTHFSMDNMLIIHGKQDKNVLVDLSIYFAKLFSVKIKLVKMAGHDLDKLLSKKILTKI